LPVTKIAEVQMRAVAVVLVGMMLSQPLTAQAWGDSVRVYLESGEVIQGRLLDIEQDTVTVRWQFDERILTSVQKLEVWRPRNAAIDISLGTVAWGIFGWSQSWGDGEPVTGSTTGDVLLGAGIGLLGAVMVHQIWPGRWKRVDFP
jgi:hypothetical protein